MHITLFCFLAKTPLMFFLPQCYLPNRKQTNLYKLKCTFLVLSIYFHSLRNSPKRKKTLQKDHYTHTTHQFCYALDHLDFRGLKLK